MKVSKTNGSVTTKQQELKERCLEELQREVSAGLAELEAGETVAYSSSRAVADDVKARGRATLAHQAAKTSSPYL